MTYGVLGAVPPPTDLIQQEEVFRIQKKEKLCVKKASLREILAIKETTSQDNPTGQVPGKQMPRPHSLPSDFSPAHPAESWGRRVPVDATPKLEPGPGPIEAN